MDIFDSSGNVSVLKNVCQKHFSSDDYGTPETRRTTAGGSIITVVAAR